MRITSIRTMPEWNGQLKKRLDLYNFMIISVTSGHLSLKDYQESTPTNNLDLTTLSKTISILSYVEF